METHYSLNRKVLGADKGMKRGRTREGSTPQESHRKETGINTVVFREKRLPSLEEEAEKGRIGGRKNRKLGRESKNKKRKETKRRPMDRNPGDERYSSGQYSPNHSRRKKESQESPKESEAKSRKRKEHHEHRKGKPGRGVFGRQSTARRNKPQATGTKKNTETTNADSNINIIPKKNTKK